MPRKHNQARREETLSECQLSVLDISAKLGSIGTLIQDRDPESSEPISGIGLLLSEFAKELEEIADRLDPVNLK